MRRATVLVAVFALGLGGCSARARAGVEVQAGVLGEDPDGDRDREDGDSGRVWVCHRGRWQEVGAPAADAHRGHGDRVSTSERENRAAC